MTHDPLRGIFITVASHLRQTENALELPFHANQFDKKDENESRTAH